MSSIAFSKILHGGNSTIILTGTDLSPDELPDIAAALMHPLHLQAEQVGALFLRGALPHLQMMGGEFCVNATRSAALLLARNGRLSPFLPGCLYGEITVSGMASPIHILAASGAEELAEGIASPLPGDAYGAAMDKAHSPKERYAFTNAVRLHCAARILCGAGCTKILDLSPGTHMVHLPGISHLLLEADAHPMPRQWRKTTADWRRQTGLDTAPASGVVWYRREDDGYHIWPAVEVRATGSEHMETACGSASLALSLLHYAGLTPPLESDELPLGDPRPQTENGLTTRITQLSGETLEVILQFETGSGDAQPLYRPSLPTHAWVSGRVILVAEGATYVAP